MNADFDPEPDLDEHELLSEGLVVTDNRQCKCLVEPGRWAELMELVLCEQGLSQPWEAGLCFVGVVEMTELNESQRGFAKPTDVLALGTDDGSALRAAGEPRLIGDVVICPAIAAVNAKDRQKTLDEELALLVVHGTLHLLGYDHQTDVEAAHMQQREQELLAQVFAGGELAAVAEMAR